VKEENRKKDTMKGALVAITIMVVATVLLAGILYVWVSGLADTDEASVGFGYAEYDYNNPNDEPYADMYFKDYGTNPFIATEDAPNSTFAMDVDTGSYTLTRSYIERGSLPPSDAIRVEELINYFDHDYESEGKTFSIDVEGAMSRFGEDNKHLLQIGIQAKDIPLEDRRGLVLVFVIDVSSSMNRENRLELVKQSLFILTETLQDGDKVGLVTYGSRGHRVLDPTDNIKKLEKSIKGLSPGGSTNAYEGLSLGYDMATEYYEEGKINRIILCSDGVANTGKTS